MDFEFLSGCTEFVRFTGDGRNLTVGNKTGYRICCSETLDSLYEHAADDVILVERLLDSPLVVLVTSCMPRVLKLFDVEERSLVWTLGYDNNIVDIQANSKIMAVCLEESVFLHSMNNLEICHVIYDLPVGCSRLGVLSDSFESEKCFFVYPCSSETGNFKVLDIFKKENVATIHAHENPIAMMAINREGTVLATVSKRGTLIRLIAFPVGILLTEYKRGFQLAEVYSMRFSEDSKFLCCSFSTGTVHIFSLANKSEHEYNPEDCISSIGSTALYMLSRNRDLTIRKREDEESNSWRNVGDRVFSTATSITSFFYDQWSRPRAFAVARVPSKGIRCIATLRTSNTNQTVLVASKDGHVYNYSFDPIKGGECELEETTFLAASAEDSESYEDCEDFSVNEDNGWASAKEDN